MSPCQSALYAAFQSNRSSPLLCYFDQELKDRLQLPKYVAAWPWLFHFNDSLVSLSQTILRYLQGLSVPYYFTTYTSTYKHGPVNTGSQSFNSEPTLHLQAHPKSPLESLSLYQEFYTIDCR